MNETNAPDNLALASQKLLVPSGIDVNDLRKTLDQVMTHQVDFADLYLQSIRRESWSLENSQVKAGSFSVDQGFGLRASELDQTAFAYSQQITRKRLSNAAASVRSIAGKGSSARIGMPQQRIITCPSYGTHDPLAASSAAANVALLEQVERYARNADPRVTHVSATLELTHEVIMVMRHDGRLAADVRPLVLMFVRVIVQQNGKRETATGGLGGRNGFWHFEADKLPNEVTRIVN